MRILLPLLLILLLLSCQTSPAPAPTQSGSETPTAMSVNEPDSLLRHVVLFSFKEESYPEGARQVEEAFAALPGKIPEIYDYEWGTNNSPEELNRGLTHAFLVTFKSEADRAVYLPHPDHLAFVKVLKPHLKDVTVLDYWAK